TATTTSSATTPSCTTTSAAAARSCTSFATRPRARERRPMHASTATRPSTLDADAGAERPRIGLLGVMQRLYDEMLPGITERPAGYARELAAALDDVATVFVSEPVKDRAGVERALQELEREELDGLLVAMLTYGPAMNVARALGGTRLPVCVVNTQPV